jgi:hypothetical protein
MRRRRGLFFRLFRTHIDLHDHCSRRRTHWQFTPYQRSIEQLPEGLWHGDDSELDGEAIPARLTNTPGVRLRRPRRNRHLRLRSYAVLVFSVVLTTLAVKKFQIGPITAAKSGAKAA